MTTPYLPGLVRIQPQWQDESGHVDECVMHALVSTSLGPLSPAQLIALQTAVDNAWTAGSPSLKANTISSYKYIGSIITDQQSNTGLQENNSAFTPSPGSITGVNPNTRQVAGVISLVTAFRYRGGHGRAYVPGAPSNAQNPDGKTWTSGYQSSMQNWATAILVNLLAATPAATVCILRSRTQVVPHTIPKTYVPPFTTPVLFANAQGIVATQRRRLRKVAHT